MAAEFGSPISPGNSGSSLPAAEGPSWRWLLGWVLLITAAFPAASLATAPIAAALLWLIDLGAKTGFWASYQGICRIPIDAGKK
jgi:squalene cyclase